VDWARRRGAERSPANRAWKAFRSMSTFGDEGGRRSRTACVCDDLAPSRMCGGRIRKRPLRTRVGGAGRDWASRYSERPPKHQIPRPIIRPRGLLRRTTDARGMEGKYRRPGRVVKHSRAATSCTGMRRMASVSCAACVYRARALQSVPPRTRTSAVGAWRARRSLPIRPPT
jgi:hypothetical protein